MDGVIKRVLRGVSEFKSNWVYFATETKSKDFMIWKMVFVTVVVLFAIFIWSFPDENFYHSTEAGEPGHVGFALLILLFKVFYKVGMIILTPILGLALIVLLGIFGSNEFRVATDVMMVKTKNHCDYHHWVRDFAKKLLAEKQTMSHDEYRQIKEKYNFVKARRNKSIEKKKKREELVLARSRAPYAHEKLFSMLSDNEGAKS